MLGKALDASRQEMEAAHKAADAAGKTAQAADSAARAATGVAQQAERLAREAAVGAPRLFTSLPAAGLSEIVTVIGSNGFSEVGAGAATYVSDANATADLARLHPRACFKGEGNRYFRLVPDAQGVITPEQFGCPVPAIGINAQPYLQAALNYAAAVPAVRQISMTQNYDLWAPLRTSGTPTTVQQADYLYFRRAVKIVGTASSLVRLRFLNSQGGRNDVITQRVVLPGIAGFEGGHDENDYPWMGSGLVKSESAPLLDFVHIEKIEMDSTYTYDESKLYTPDGQRALHSVNLMHKGFLLGGEHTARRVFMRNVVMRNWAGEICYLGGGEVEETYFENCEFRGSPQCAINPGTPALATYVNVTCADSFQNEIIGGRGTIFVGGLWSNLRGAAVIGGAAGDGQFRSDYPYFYPFRLDSGSPPFTRFQDLRIERCREVTVGSYLQGKLLTVQSTINLSGSYGKLEDIDLDIHAMCDGPNPGSALTIAGPLTTSEQVAHAPSGVCQQVPRNINVRLNTTRSRKAEETLVPGGHTASWQAAVEYYGGLIDTKSVKITVDGTADSPFRSPNGINGQAPLIVIAPSFKRSNPDRSQPNTALFLQPGSFDVPIFPGDTPIIMEGTPGIRRVRMNGTKDGKTWGWADGTEVSLTVVGVQGGLIGDGVTYAVFDGADGSGYIVPETRLLGRAGDRITFKRDNQNDVWVEVWCQTKVQTHFTGSGNIPAQQIAAGATVTIDFPLTGLRATEKRRDIVEWIEPTPGFVTSGAVISNHAVRVSVTNTGAAPAALPGGIRRVRVLHGYAT